MNDLAVVIEAIRSSDGEAIEKLNARAFGPGRFARSAFRVREQAGESAAFGFVARIASLLVGSVLLTPARIDKRPMLMLGPLTVEPAFEGRGIGRMLLSRSVEAAREHGFALILLVGDAAYYSKHGYRVVPPGQITLPGPVDPARLLAYELEPGALADAKGMMRGGC